MADLVDWLLDQINDGDLDGPAQDALIGALMPEGEGRTEAAGPDDDSPTGSEAMPGVGVYLKSISVRGFRGIGPRAALLLHPGPGLVVVAGRNGSGKSSFAEALEVTLTRRSYRWQDRASQWTGNWRNLHDGANPDVVVEIVEQDHGISKVGAEWAAGSEFTAQESWVQRSGQRRSPGLEALGWGDALETFRPMLSYDELGGIFADNPSALHDALERILGLGQLKDALQRLDADVKRLRDSRKRATSARAPVRDLLAACTDDRAVAAHALFKKTGPDREKVRSLIAIGATPDTGPVAFLRAVVRLRLPDADELDVAISALEQAVLEREASEAEAAGADRDRLGLLAHALEVMDRNGSDECPVCGNDELDEGWTARLRAHVAEQQQELDRRTEIRRRAADAARDVRALVAPVPAVLRGPSAVELASLAPLQDAWTSLASLPESDVAVAEHLRTTSVVALAALRAAQDDAGAELGRRDDEWAGVVLRVAEWLDLADRAAADAPLLAPVQAAHIWLKDNIAALRNERLVPLAERARHIWASLRQESNVELGRVALEGTSTRRHVDLTAEVDGADAGALSVMSQGELHALALALFIPRATADDSPFQFLILDDPIQAMDPAKVDGFVRVLADLATTREVVVFSHDDRLPSAVRSLDLDARILEVQRRPGSVLTVRNALDPATRYLEDARALANDPEVGLDVERAMIPVLCRLAVEAVARDRFYAAALEAGRPRDEVEAVWSASLKTGVRVSMAVFGDNRPLDPWLVPAKPWRRRALGIVTSGAHRGLQGPTLNAVEDVERLVGDLR